MSSEMWEMPKWMEPYRSAVQYTAGISIEQWMNSGSDANRDRQSWYQKGVVSAQIALLHRLHSEGNLK